MDSWSTKIQLPIVKLFICIGSLVEQNANSLYYVFMLTITFVSKNIITFRKYILRRHHTRMCYHRFTHVRHGQNPFTQSE